jgi:uncharacterized protein YdaU (DUF1376 family)
VCLVAKPPAFQFYAKDFLAGTMDMSLLEIGAYTKFLAWSWDSGPLPLADFRRASILGVSVRSLTNLWPGIQDKWTETPEGFVNDRLERQRSELQDFRRRQSDRGAKGAKEKWRKHGASIGAGTPQAVAQAQPDDGSAICTLQSADHTQSQDRSECVTHERANLGGRWAPAAMAPVRGGLDGAAMRTHGQHAWCSLPRDGFCVPRFLHDEFIGKRGTPKAAAELLAWYPATVREFDGIGVGENSITFWRNRFAAWTGTVTRAPVVHSDKAERTMAAAEKLIEKQLNRKAIGNAN